MSCHSFIFFDSSPNIATVPKRELKEHKTAFIALLKELSHVTVAGYATLGFKQGTRFMLHFAAEEAENIQNCVQSLMHTSLGEHLVITYTLLGLVRPSQYKTQGPREENEFIDGAKKYLIVYPFTKTTEWHLLPFEERKEMMKEHVITARKFSASINQLLLYSYGIDDHEFIVSYQTDSLLDFQTLVMELRNTKGREYTKNDLPIFTCTHVPLKDVLQTI